jgi:hypothetical protein
MFILPILRIVIGWRCLGGIGEPRSFVLGGPSLVFNMDEHITMSMVDRPGAKSAQRRQFLPAG